MFFLVILNVFSFGPGSTAHCIRGFSPPQNTGQNPGVGLLITGGEGYQQKMKKHTWS